jgi:hypothetical protein
MKRFTATEKWPDPWFRKLPPFYKLFFLYLLDTCDMAGFWDPDMELASFMIGAPLDQEEALRLFNTSASGGSDRVKVVADGKWWLTKFIQFQQGELNPANPCHKGVLKTLLARGFLGPYEDLARTLEVASKGLPSPTSNSKGKGKGKGTEGGAGETSPPDRGGIEIPDKDQAIAMTVNAGVAPDFASYVYDDWAGRGGNDANRCPRKWLEYITTRWSRESPEWMNGTHHGKKRNGKIITKAKQHEPYCG